MTSSPVTLTDATGIERFRGTQAPGGGSQPGALRMLGPFTIGPDDFVGPDGFGFIAAPIYTPTPGDAILGFSWLLRVAYDVNFTECNIAPQTSADTGTAGPALISESATITMQTVQGQGAGNTGGDYFASSFLPLDRYDATTGGPVAPSTVGPVISDGTTLYLAGSLHAGSPPDAGQLDIYVYVATPALA